MADFQGEKFKEYLNKHNIKTAEAARRLKVSRQTVHQYYASLNLSRETVSKILTTFETTSKEVFGHDEEVEEPPTNNTLTNTEKAVPVFDVQFSAGTLLNLVELRNTDYPIAWLNIPEVAGCDAIIRARGKSMEPLINDGDWIGLKQEEYWREWLPKDYIYAISTTTMMLIKKVTSVDDLYFYISSANPEYNDDKIPKKFIYDVWSVKTILPFSKIVTLL